MRRLEDEKNGDTPVVVEVPINFLIRTSRCLKVEKLTGTIEALKEKNIKVRKLLSLTKMVKAVRVEGDAVTFPVDKEVDGAYL